MSSALYAPLPLLCLLLASAIPAPLRAQESGVVINEVLYAPENSDLEFVELYNRSERTADLSRLSLSDSRSEPTPVAAAPSPLRPGAYAVLVRSTADFSQAFPQVNHVEVPSWPALNNSGDVVTVYYNEQPGIYVPLDSVSYGPGWSPRGISLERRDPRGPSTAGNFGPSTAPGGATPGARNSIYAPDRHPPAAVFAEQESLHTVLVYFDERLDSTELRALDFRLPAQQAVQASLPAPSRVRLRFAAAITGTMLTISDIVDAAGNRSGPLSLPLARLAEAGELVVSEMLYAPLSDDYDGRPNQPEYVELYNRTNHLISLHDLYITDRPDEHGKSDTLRLAPDPVGLPPDGYAVVFSEPDSVDDPAASTLALSFPTLRWDDPSVLLLPLPRASLGLSNEGDIIVLHRRDGTILDSLAYHPSWHHPGVVKTRGVALERISVVAPSHERTTWTSSASSYGGTPGGPNSVGNATPPAAADTGLKIIPSPFSPNGDGFDDHARIQYRLAQRFSVVRARVFDRHGRLVRTLTEATASGPTGELIWDGRDDLGHPLRLGIYIVLLDVVDAASGASAAHKGTVVLARPLNWRGDEAGAKLEQ